MINLNPQLFKIGNSSFRLNHLLIIGILVLSFSISFLLRSLPYYYGWELNEFDPFFNYRATLFLLENGPEKYFLWNDDLSWYPLGRNVSETSQVTLHFFTAGVYYLFNFGSQLYDFVIIFPVIVGSLTGIIIFALVRNLGGTSAGLLASLLFSMSLPILLRGTQGWFKSEPLGLFFGILGTYLFISGINSRKNHSYLRMGISGLILILGLSSWGGDQFFILAISMALIPLSFFTKDKNDLFFKIIIFTTSLIITSLLFEKTYDSFTRNYLGYAFFASVAIFSISHFLRKLIPDNKKIILIFFCILIGFSILFFVFSENILHSPSFRYINAINPFESTSNPLTQSVSENATTSVFQSFFLHSLYLIFSGIGVWILLSNNNKPKIFSNFNISFILISALLGIYLASTFGRMGVFSSIGLILLSSIGLSIFFKQFIELKKKHIYTILGLSMIFILLIVPQIPFNNNNSFSILAIPPTILNGGSANQIVTNDWQLTLEWIKNNTESNSVIGSWWDYGYWIQTLSDRPTLADNSTLSNQIIEEIAKILFMTPDDAWNSLQEKEADYFVIFIAGERFNVNSINNEGLYNIGAGGDESKIIWFTKIAGQPAVKYLHSDYLSGTDEFWNNTFLGKLIPFELVGYVDLATQKQSLTYVPGYTGVYSKNIKFTETDLFTLVYHSPSFDVGPGEKFSSVLVYKIND